MTALAKHASDYDGFRSTSSPAAHRGASLRFFFFFLNDPPPPEIYTFPLHDALPISPSAAASRANSAKYCGDDFGYTMRSPSRLGKPALGMPLVRLSSTAASSCKIGSSACGPSVQFAPITCTFLLFSCAAASEGRMSPWVVPSSE